MSLKQLIEELTRSIRTEPLDVPRVAECTQHVLEALQRATKEEVASVGGLLLRAVVSNMEIWQRLETLPGDLSSIIEDMATCMDDTERAPDIARNFASTPAQLLDRFMKWKAGTGT